MHTYIIHSYTHAHIHAHTHMGRDATKGTLRRKDQN